MMEDQVTKEKQEYSCYTPWQVYGIGWSVRPDRPYRLALGSFVEKGTNAIRVVQLNPVCVFLSLLFSFPPIFVQSL